MKVCDNCNKVNPDEVGKCLECGMAEFTPLLFPEDGPDPDNSIIPEYDRFSSWAARRKDL